MGEKEEEEESEIDEQADNTAGAGNPVFDGLQSASASGQKDNNSEAMLSPPDFPNNYSSQSNSSREDVDVMQGKKKETSRVGAEEFPLPPPTNILIQRQQALAAQEAQSAQRPGSLQTLQAPSGPSASPAKPPQIMADSRSQSSANSTYSETQAATADNAYPSHQQLFRNDAGSQQQLDRQETVAPSISKAFRALPLLSSDLPHTTITVSHSFVRPNDRGKEVLSFIVFVNPGNGKEGWKVEKMYSDVLSLDQRVRNSVGKGVGKKIANLPEGKLWKDHAPAKVDQRKAVLENYLQTLIQLPVKNNDEVIAFFTSDIVKDQKMPVMQAGHKEGYLTKRGKNFGGWKTRFFVLQGPVLEYYDCRGGAHLGSITITGAQIARQHRTERPPSADDEKEYRHAFLIVEAKKGPGGNHPRHVLCAESDEDRDSWVEMLVRYYTGTYSEDLVFLPATGLTTAQTNALAVAQLAAGPPRSSTSSTDMSSASTPRKAGPRGMSREEPARVSAIPISLLPPDASNQKLFQPVPTSEDYMRSSSPSRSIDPSPIDRRGPSAAGGIDMQKRALDQNLGLPSSLPDSSPLSSSQSFQSDPPASAQRANSELGHYPDLLQDGRAGHGQHKGHRQHSPERHRPRDDGRKSFYPSLNIVSSSPTVTAPPERAPSPEKPESSKVKISGPMDGQILPSGFKFGKEAPPSNSASSSNDRRDKAKSRLFWGFGKGGEKSHPHAAYPPRAVFGVPLEEALDVAQICNLPAIVFRSIQYLEAKKADQEEGIYRLSGSSAVIKNLKDMFNNEGDVDLLSSDEYWDPHAIAGLLKGFLRELPNSILTRELHMRFLSVIDFVDPQERIKELSQLIAALPLANYTLLRALTAHLILIVQNSNVNKMTMRNVGIVFSPTLGIPAGVFSLMLGEFNRVFNVENGDASTQGDAQESSSEPLRRNSRQYSDAAADQVLGLSGRTLTTPAEEAPSDGDDFSIQDDSGTETTEGEVVVESSTSSSPVSAPGQPDSNVRGSQADTPNTPTAKTSKASTTASSRGLNVAVTHSDRGNRHSRMMGLPLSPRPAQHSPSRSDMPTNGSPPSHPNE
ncbi:RhoGAP-domain-containing protein [Agrocybe pediades]|nr:RhoGAP-domain-containing protein [Agrocybe pediades]